MTIRGSGRDQDRGSVTLTLVVLAISLLVAVGLIVDGGQKIRAAQEADSVAAEAARAAGQALAAVTIPGGAPIVDPVIAAAAAQNHLTAAGVPGSVTILAGGTRIQVSTRIDRPTVFLALVGVGTVTGEGLAVAELIDT